MLNVWCDKRRCAWGKHYTGHDFSDHKWCQRCLVAGQTLVFVLALQLYFIYICTFIFVLHYIGHDFADHKWCQCCLVAGQTFLFVVVLAFVRVLKSGRYGLQIYLCFLAVQPIKHIVSKFQLFSSDRSSCTDDGLLYIYPHPLFQILSIYAFLYCYKCHSKSLKQYQCNWCHRISWGYF